MAGITIGELTAIPSGWHLVWDVERRRSGVPVRVRRWQATPERALGAQQVSIVTESDGGRVLSIRRFVTAEHEMPVLPPSPPTVFAAIDPPYARGLTPMRVDPQQRSWRDLDGTQVVVPVTWAKFAHRNGTYNWVSTANNGRLVEYEVESRWDYAAGRRATEQWDNDAWIAAREGSGPQLSAPDARA